MACNKKTVGSLDIVVEVDESGDVRLSAEDIKAKIDAAEDGETIKFKAGTYWGTVFIHERRNLTLDFSNVKLLTKKDETIFFMDHCSGIKIKGLTLYHDVGQVGCFTNCFDVDHSQNISFEDCDINGSGFIGVCVNQCTSVSIKNCKIHKCTFGIFIWENNEHMEGLKVTTSDVTISKCTFDTNKVGNVCFDHNYARVMEFNATIDGKKFKINKDNFENYKKNYDYVLD